MHIKQKIYVKPSALLQAPSSPNQRSAAKRYFVCTLIVFLSALAAYQLGIKLFSNIHLLRAEKFIHQNHYGLGSSAFQMAASYQPMDYHLQRGWGDVYHHIGNLSPSARSAYAAGQKAKRRYEKALQLNPLDSRSAYCLASAEDRLEQLYVVNYPSEQNNPHDALPYYKMAIRLRPNGILYHYALVRYLHRKNSVAEMLRIVRALARMYPLAYYHLKKEDFWSATVNFSFRQGLYEAIENRTLPAAAHMILASLKIDEKDWAGAITNYQKALEVQPQRKTEEAFYHLGGLFIKNREMDAAQASFLESLSLSRTKEARLQSIYQVFRNEGRLVDFIEFCHQVVKRFSLSFQTGILFARSLIDLNQVEQARRILEELNAEDPSAEAYYWLARIAEKEADWDQMERAIQKATVLEPENDHYHQIFINLLKRLKKFDHAERQLDLIIANSSSLTAERYNEKALLRLKQNDYAGALKSWQAAIRLEPDRAAFHAQAAEAYIMMGKFSKAVEYYHNAAKLDPQNERYKERYQQIVGNDAEG